MESSSLSSSAPATSPVAAVQFLFTGLYRKYWIAWCVLLALTLVMVLLQNPVVLMAGITIKAAVILLVFMHLKYEHPGLVLSVFVGIFATTLLLYLLLVPDGRAM